jgi:hypothetical protein
MQRVVRGSAESKSMRTTLLNALEILQVSLGGGPVRGRGVIQGG